MAGFRDSWKKELDELVNTTGISFTDVCAYIGSTYSKSVGFYYKTPKKRESLIGIGMAFACDLDTINRWIQSYAGKNRLYSKKVLSDMIWIYLINSNKRHGVGAKGASEGVDIINYYSMYDECREAVLETYIRLWNEYVSNAKGTVDVDRDLDAVNYDERFEGLRAFVAENMDSFKSAYNRPRKMLQKYVSVILSVHSAANDGKGTPINYLRGYLDDSMINYITGSSENINVVDMKSRNRVINAKAVPKLRKTHISMCLALGMCTGEINEYLEMMGYASLNERENSEDELIKLLGKWEADHPKVYEFKTKYLNGRADAELTGSKEELRAVSEMLMLRSDLKYEARKTGKDFPYMKD